MMHILAHFTSLEAPAGALLFLAGFALGTLAPKLLRHFRTH